MIRKWLKRKKSPTPAGLRVLGIQSRVAFVIGGFVATLWVAVYSVPTFVDAFSLIDSPEENYWHPASDLPDARLWLLLASSLGACLTLFLRPGKYSLIQGVRSCWFPLIWMGCGIPYLVLTVPNDDIWIWIKTKFPNKETSETVFAAFLGGAFFLPLLPAFLINGFDDNERVVAFTRKLGGWSEGEANCPL